MGYTVIDHGDWERYVPDPFPEGAPAAAMFARRIADGQDWYQLAHDPESFPTDSALATCLPTPDGLLVQAVVWDRSLLFPVGHKLIEIRGIDPSTDKPHRLFEQKLVDIGTGTFLPKPEPKVRQVSAAQAKTALFQAGLLEFARAAVKGHPYPPVEIYWDSAIYWEIDNPYVQAIAEELNLNATQLQALFDAASKL